MLNLILYSLEVFAGFSSLKLMLTQTGLTQTEELTGFTGVILSALYQLHLCFKLSGQTDHGDHGINDVDITAFESTADDIDVCIYLGWIAVFCDK